MVLRDLKIENFKSIKSVNLECKRINLIIGEPNSGKSNILDAIGFLSSLAGYSTIHEYTRIDKDKAYLLFHRMETNKPARIMLDSERLKIKEIIIKYNDKTGIGVEFKNKEGKETILDVLSISSAPRISDDLSYFKLYRFVRTSYMYKREGTFLKPPQGDNFLQMLLNYERLRDVVGSLLSQYGYLLTIDDFENRIELISRTGLESDIAINPFKFPLHMVSDTILRTLLHLAAIYTNRDSVIAFEEPEAHAFPFNVREIAESIALRREDGNQYFITTHNPFFLISVIEKAGKDDVALFVTRIENYETVVNRIADEGLEEILDLGYDVFFNLDRLIKKVTKNDLI